MIVCAPADKNYESECELWAVCLFLRPSFRFRRNASETKHSFEPWSLTIVLRQPSLFIGGVRETSSAEVDHLHDSCSTAGCELS